MVFVGEGADGAEIRSYAEERKLSDRCFFTGAISDREIIRAWYGRSDLFLFPSTFDTNGLVVREAAASGTATVMIRNSCASEGVGDGRNGFCIEENAAAGASRAVRRDKAGARRALRDDFAKSGPLFMRKRRAKIRSSFLLNLRVLAFPRRTTCSTGRSTPYATPRPRKLDARATAVRAHSRSP